MEKLQGPRKNNSITVALSLSRVYFSYPDMHPDRYITVDRKSGDTCPEASFVSHTGKIKPIAA
ncbi:MAG: hypothetical protein HKN42_03855 [Granulosicoccus sp.]|nr:hypothetical protein [Granulosicoccus sp.]